MKPLTLSKGFEKHLSLPCLSHSQVGTKYDQFSAFTREEQDEITRQVRMRFCFCRTRLR